MQVKAKNVGPGAAAGPDDKAGNLARFSWSKLIADNAAWTQMVDTSIPKVASARDGGASNAGARIVRRAVASMLGRRSTRRVCIIL